MEPSVKDDSNKSDESSKDKKLNNLRRKGPNRIKGSSGSGLSAKSFIEPMACGSTINQIDTPFNTQ